MYLSFFGLSEKPFAITPDPRYLYLSERHAEALAHLLYGINESGGFIQLTGEVGTGKTTVVRTLLSRVPHHADVAVILNPRVTPVEFLLIILIGQPELRDLLDRNELRQLAQRITGRYHLKPLSREETQGYVRHRLRIAGATGEIFTPGALRELHRLSSGIPRVINVSCDRALLGAYTREARKVSAGLVRQAAGEVYGRRFVPVWLGWVTGVGLAASFAALGLIGFRTWQHQSA